MEFLTNCGLTSAFNLDILRLESINFRPRKRSPQQLMPKQAPVIPSPSPQVAYAGPWQKRERPPGNRLLENPEVAQEIEKNCLASYFADLLEVNYKYHHEELRCLRTPLLAFRKSKDAARPRRSLKKSVTTHPVVIHQQSHDPNLWCQFLVATPLIGPLKDCF